MSALWALQMCQNVRGLRKFDVHPPMNSGLTANRVAGNVEGLCVRVGNSELSALDKDK